MRNYTVKHQITPENLKDMIMLDSRSYTPNERGELELCLSWYHKNPDIYTVLLDGDKVIGYINFLPVKPEVYEKMKAGKMTDKKLSANDIEKFEPNKNHCCLFMSVVLDENYRLSKALLVLMEGFYKKMKTFKQQNIQIKSVLADCVSKQGELYAIRQGFSYVKHSDHNSVIYEKIILN
jgi:hypothetical protein